MTRKKINGLIGAALIVYVIVAAIAGIGTLMAGTAHWAMGGEHAADAMMVGLGILLSVVLAQSLLSWALKNS